MRQIESLERRQMLNAAPVANDDAYTVAEDTVLSGASSLLANDTDADNDLLTAVLVSGPDHGTLNLKADGTFTYTPAANFAGIDTFTYAAMDGQGEQDKATVAITVIGENEPPTVNNQTFSVAENSANGTAVGTVVAADPDTGDVLTYALSGSGEALAIDSAGKITVVNNSQLDFETKATFNLIVTVSDNEGASDTATITINVTNANDPPIIVAPVTDVTVAEESSPTMLNVSGVFADQDKDTLTFSVVSDNPGLVTPSISGSDLKLTYNVNKFGTANITLTANDGKGGTASDTFAVNVANVNDPPIANDDTFSALAGKAVSGNVLPNDIDPDGDTLSAFLNSATKFGTLSFQSNGTFTFTANEKFSGADTFTYTATDGKTSDAATVTINVFTPQNPPDAKDDSFTTPHNTPVSGSVLANDTDPDGDKLFATLLSSPANGNVALNFDGSFTYAPNIGFLGTDSFTYRTSDGRGGTDSAKVQIIVTLPAALDASDDFFTNPEDTVVTGNLLANDIDPEGDKFSLTSVSPPSSGSLVIDPAGDFIYTPLANFFGTDTFTYTVQDTTGSTDTAKVTLTFGAVNDVDAVNDAFSGKMNTRLTVAAPGVLANDVDPDTNPEHKFAITGVIPATGTTSKGGAFEIRADGSFDVTPAFNFSGADSFSYTIGDGAGAKDTATVTITFEHVNIAPDAKDDNAIVSQDSTENFIAVLANDTDFDGNPLFVAAVTPPANGTVTLVPGNAQTGGGVRYTPNFGFRGIDSFTYTVTDGQGGSDSATVVVTVAPPVNPDAVDDFFILVEDTVLFGNLLANDFDLEGDKLVLVSTTTPSSGILITDSAGNFSYFPSNNFVGDASFMYTMTDGNGTFDTASVTVRVTNINDIPDAKDDAASAGADKVTINVLANDNDADLANPVHTKFNTEQPDALRVIAVGIAANGQTALNSDGSVSYTPNMFFAGSDSFTYTISDRGQDGIAGTADDKTDTAKVTVTVTDPFPDPFARDDAFKVNEDTIRNALDVLKNDLDVEGDSFKVTGVTQGSKGIVEIGTNGANVLYTPDPNFVGSDNFTYTITDSTGASDTATVTVQVINVNDPPDAKNDTATGDTKATVINVLANDVDPEGGKLTVTKVTQGTGGTVTIGADGANVAYTPNPGFVGSDLFTYTITDPEGATDTATVLVTIFDHDPFPGSDGDDVFYVRRDTAGTSVLVFANDTGTGTAIFSAPIDTAPRLTFDTLGGNDRLIVDAVNGNPIPTLGIAYAGGANGTTGDRLTLRNGGITVGTYRPSASTTGNGVVTVLQRNIDLTGVEPIDVSAFTSFTVVTSNASDTLTITRPAAETTQLAGASNGVAISPVSITNVSSLIIDAASNDGGAGNDSLTINASGNVPSNVGFMEYRSGTGSNTLTIQNGSARIDSTVAAEGSLDTTVATGAELITHRLRQNGLVLSDGASTVLLPDGADAATSVVTGLTIGAGATLDINDNAVIVNYTGASPEATVRAKILEGRGGAGLGNGAWTGTGITSSSAAAANALDPESRSIGFGDNATLPLGSYSSFRGVAVDSSSILITYTRTGDASLNGIVDDNDVTIVNTSYNPSGMEPRWAYGNFEYDSGVNDDDVTLLGAFYDPSAPPYAPPGPAPAPLTAAGDRVVLDAVFAEIGVNGQRALAISAAELTAIADEVFAVATRKARLTSYRLA